MVEFALEEPKFSQFLGFKNREILPGKKSTAAYPLPFMEIVVLLPPGNYSPKPCSGGTIMFFLGKQPKSCSSKEQPCFSGEQMCLIFCMIIIFVLNSH